MDKIVIKYQLEGKDVTKEQFEEFKSTLRIDSGSMVEGFGRNMNVQSFKATDQGGTAYEYKLDSFLNEAGDETQTRQIVAVPKPTPLN